MDDRYEKYPGFVEFWKQWPSTICGSPNWRKTSKNKCLKRWIKDGLESKADVVLAALNGIRNSRGWRDGFIPAPLVWLNNQRWDCDLAMTKKQRDEPSLFDKPKPPPVDTVDPKPAIDAALAGLDDEELRDLKREVLADPKWSDLKPLRTGDEKTNHWLRALMAKRLEQRPPKGAV